MPNLARFERQLGYRFNRVKLLELALTHRSFGSQNNERLEFLGDALLGAVIADALFHQFPNASEGELTRMRARLVSGKTLAEVAHELNFKDNLVLGSGEARSGGSQRASIRADAFEAVLGAICLDSDFETVRQVVLNLFEKRLRDVTPDAIKDPKTLLQETLQKGGRPLPEYHIISKVGRPHDLHFMVECRVKEPSAQKVGEGKSRRVAEQNAAQALLDIL